MKSAVFSIIAFLWCFIVIAQEDKQIKYPLLQTISQSPAEQAPGTQKQYHVVLSADPVGFLLFGPSVHIEPFLSKYLTVNAGIRFHNLGLVQTAVYGSMKMSYMIHGELRIYPIPKNRSDGFFFGPGIEYGRSNYSSGATYYARAYGGGLGYKWIFKNGLCLELCDLIGVVQSKRINVSYGADWHTDMFIFYMLSAKAGIAF